MAITTFVTPHLPSTTGVPISRVRRNVQRLRQRVEIQVPAGLPLSFHRGRKAHKTRVLAELDAILAEFKAVDDLLIRANLARAKLSKRAPAILEFVSITNTNLAQLAPRKRRPLTTSQQILANAKKVLTRTKRGTKSRKQRLAIKPAGALDVEVTVGAKREVKIR